MSGRRGGKTLIITDDEEEVQNQDVLNPFSFREFLRWKNQDQNQNQDQTEEAWGRSFVDGSLSICSTKDNEDDEEETSNSRFSSKPEGGAGENYEGDDETLVSEAAGPSRTRTGSSSQVQQLKEENASLRRTIMELQRSAHVQQSRVSELNEELLQRRRQEEKEAQDLENMVQSVEQNLQLMTRRAVKAESSVSRLKTDLQQLQVEMDSLRAENERLKAAESQVVMTMRQNAQMASDYLNKSASHAHSSIRQLLQEADTFRLVSQLLKSIDKISTET
ncbi:endosome-associated-trafficking regulator 1 isoform X1 [Cyprinodon tularosa]|uniref:endosome-associated-trafficking regulator 1 isoform X1 n=1 Tax=Cyprinodon tularosa TaxID=77115 RepID=UPI0018E284A9|nr:endosome-associated-trafficking regulator 1 isoform X1 [Cyprinodon tularosa]